MACDEDSICLVEIIMGILEKHDIDQFKAIEINDEIVNALPKPFTFNSLNLEIDLGDVKIVSDNSTKNTKVIVGDNNDLLYNITSIKWELDANDALGKLNIELTGFCRKAKNKDE